MNFFADTSGWMSLFNTKEARYSAVRNWMDNAAGQGHHFIVTDYVLDETITGLLGRVDHHTAAAFAKWILKQKHITILNITEEIWHDALEMFYRYDDKQYSFTDCTSFVVMQKRKLRDAFALDHHFEQMGFRLWPR